MQKPILLLLLKPVKGQVPDIWGLTSRRLVG